MARVDAVAVGSVLNIEVAYCPATGPADVTPVQLHAPATLRDALEASGIAARQGWVIGDALSVGVWGRRRPIDTPLCDGDRVEVYRPLAVDPMQARRLRQQAQARKRGNRKA